MGEKMKVIERCGECGFYSYKTKRCKMGAKEESNPNDPFFDDCPLHDFDEYFSQPSMRR